MIDLINQSHDILHITPNILQSIERAGRTCYKSEDRITDTSSIRFVERLIDDGHDAMLEFGDITVRFVTNRGVTHELVRHRPCSYAQESTRYVKYSKEVTFIVPVWYDERDRESSFMPASAVWYDAMERAAYDYQALLAKGWSAQQAREVLPNSLKTEIVIKANVREWRHILKLRCSNAAHPQMRALMRELLTDLQTRLPTLFTDITY